MQEGAEVHIIIQDAKDGIRDDAYLSNSKRETCMGAPIPLIRYSVCSNVVIRSMLCIVMTGKSINIAVPFLSMSIVAARASRPMCFLSFQPQGGK